jgi:predicted HicB family RNase H-like nuclease
MKMKKIIEYKGYSAEMKYSKDDDAIVARVLGISTAIAFHGETYNELEKEFHAIVDEFLVDSKSKESK